jgi:hypothetical protein
LHPAVKRYQPIFRAGHRTEEAYSTSRDDRILSTTLVMAPKSGARCFQTTKARENAPES